MQISFVLFFVFVFVYFILYLGTVWMIYLRPFQMYKIDEIEYKLMKLINKNR